MHELSISTAVVETALKHAGGRRVTQVHLRLGALRQVVPDSLEFYFEIVARETPCEGAELELEPVAALLRCGECETEWDPAASPIATHEADPLGALPSFRCPSCGSAGAEVLRGSELEVESIEVSDEKPEAGGGGRSEEDACIAPR